jgi:hypothetical protein
MLAVFEVRYATAVEYRGCESSFWLLRLFGKYMHSIWHVVTYHRQSLGHASIRTYVRFKTCHCPRTVLIGNLHAITNAPSSLGLHWVMFR